jgi:hypothetical protein
VSLSAIPKAIRKSIFDRDGGRCQYCRLTQIGQASVFHVNHIVPKSNGGLTHETNLALQCPHCSLHKSDKLIATDPHSGETFPVFHPLTQIWKEHFSMDKDGTIHGLTPIGSGTIEALRMNDPLPHIARNIQIRLGLLSPSSGNTAN